MKPESEFLPSHSESVPTTATRLFLAIGLCLAGLVALYWGTAKSLVETWAATDIFQHGFVVVPISLWLAWRLRDRTSINEVRPFWPALGAVAAAGALWTLGVLVAAQNVEHLAFVLVIQAALVTILGLQVAKTFAFPIGFLLFAVPLGEGLIPTLMYWTADFTVAALRATGVPVYRTGIHFVIPSGAWSVVEGCSGVRYLIASVMVGTLYGYLTYRSTWRRLAFVGVSVVVPIVANWLRAYMIVMIGHLSDNKYAVGVDHLLYGWLFFGVVILLMYGVGSLWREDAVEASGSRRLTWPSFSHTPHRYSFLARWWAAAALVLPIAAIWPVASGTLESRISPADPIMAEVPAANGWTKIPADPSRAPKYVGYRASLHQGFEKDGGRVGLYIAYYRGQNQGAELVNSGNHIVSSLDSTSKETGRGTTTVGWAGEAFTARTTELERQGERFQAWRWYWIDGWLTSNDYVAKVLLALARLSGRGDDAAAIVLYAAEDEAGGGAERAMTAFARDMAPGVNGVLERARGSPL